MASELPPSPPPPTPTAITGLTDDLLREVFLRLPALPSLVCAAFTCRHFHHVVRSSRAFRRSFRALHARPLLFLFLEPDMEAVRVFAWPRRCSDHLPLLLKGCFEEVYFTDHADPGTTGWEIPFYYPTSNGYLILEKGTGSTRPPRAAYNPLTQALDLYICTFDYIPFEFYTSSSEEGQGPSHVVCVRQDVGTPCHFTWYSAVVFSCDTGEWQFSRKTTEWLSKPDGARTAMVVRGLICWRGWMNEQIVVLDAATCQFSLIDLPAMLKTEDEETYKLGETKDGKFCIVDIKEETLVSWFMTADDDKIWMKYKNFSLHPIVMESVGCSMEEEGCDFRVGLVAVIDGFVYLSIFYSKDTERFELYLSLCLETSEISEIFKGPHKSNKGAQPYFMAWPPSLAQSKEESDPEYTGECIVVDDGTVGRRKASNVLVAALQSFTQAMTNDGDEYDQATVKELDAFLGPTKDDEDSLITKITILDAQLRMARDDILSIRA